MTTLIWRSAYSHLPPIADGGTMDVCRVGQIEVGRVQRIGTRGAWICWLPRSEGPSYGSWINERTWLAARAALARHVLTTLAAMGFDTNRAAPAQQGPQPTHQQEMPL